MGLSYSLDNFSRERARPRCSATYRVNGTEARLLERRLGFGSLPTKLLSSLHKIVKSGDLFLHSNFFGSHTREQKIYEFALKLSSLIDGS